MHKRNAVEAAHLECLQMFKITHLKEVTVGDNGATATHLLEGQKQHGQVDIHEMWSEEVFI